MDKPEAREIRPSRWCAQVWVEDRRDGRRGQRVLARGLGVEKADAILVMTASAHSYDPEWIYIP